MFKFVLASGLAALTTLSTQAASMQLTIDPVAKTFTFTGTDTADLKEVFRFSDTDPLSYASTVTWTVGSNTGPFELINNENSDIVLAFEGFNSTNANAGVPGRRYGLLVYEEGLDVFLFMNKDTNITPTAEFGGTGVPISYDGLLSPDAEAYLASLGGQTALPGAGISTAEGHSPIPITVVPTPSAMLMGGLSLFAVTMRRRRGRSNQTLA